MLWAQEETAENSCSNRNSNFVVGNPCSSFMPKCGSFSPPVRGEKLALKARGPEVRYQTSLFRDRHLNDLVGALYAREQACYQSQDKYCQ